MKNRRTYKIVKLDEPKVNWNEVKFYGIEEYVGGVLKRIKGKDNFYSAFENEEDAQKYIDEYCSEYYLSDYSDDEIKEFFDSINFRELFERTNKLINYNLSYITKIKDNRFGHPEHFQIESIENLTELFPILNCAWSEMKVETFNADIAVNKETGELQIWGNLHFSYKHLDGGSNGARILDFEYSKSEGWKIITELERFYQRKN